MMSLGESIAGVSRYGRSMIGNRVMNALVIWFFASLLGGSFLTPLLYDLGKDFAESAKEHNYPRFVEKIAESAQRAKPERYFNRALLVSAFAFLPFLIARIKGLSGNSKILSYEDFQLPPKTQLAYLLSGLLWGFFLVGFLFFILERLGVWIRNENQFTLLNWIKDALFPALGAGIIEELVFRGLFIGLLLKACHPVSAWILSSLTFAILHFLHPIPGHGTLNPQDWYSGFQILGSILGHFENPSQFLIQFSSLVLLGLILAWFRIWMKSLLIPVGIHIGIIMALKTSSIGWSIDTSHSLYPWWIGQDMKSGLLAPLIFSLSSLVLIAGLRRYRTLSCKTHSIE